MKATAKVAAVATGLAMATSLLSLAPIAHAQTACSVGTTDLTIGSTGAAVVCLQQTLIGMGYAIPAIQSGVAQPGYFGVQTQAAVGAWQAAKGVAPAAGYFGPISRAAWGGSSSTGGTSTVPGCAAGAMYSSTTGQACWTTSSTVPGCAAGALFSSTTGQACGTTTTTTTTGTPGAEGSFTLTQGTTPADNANVTTNSNTKVYGIKVKSTGSDMVIDRVDLEFAVTVNSSVINPSGFITSISAWDGSTLLKTMPLSSSDFTKGSTSLYSVRMTGIGFNVPKGTEKSVTFSINTNAVSSSDYTRVMTVRGENVGSNDVRGTDGAGLNTYANLTWTSSFTFTASNNSTLTGTTNTSTPKANNIATTTDGITGVVMQTFDLKSTAGASTLTDLLVTVGTSVATAKPTAVYVYDGETLLGSVAPATVLAGSTYSATFTNWTLAIAKDQTKTLTIKADFPATAVGIASTSIATSAATTAYETADETTKNVTISSALVGNDVHIYGTLAPTWTMQSATIAVTAGVANIASSTLTGTIVLVGKANGGSMEKPTAGQFSVWFASSTPSTRTTNGGTGYSAANAITIASPTVTVTPSDATVGDGSSYTVTIVGNLISSNSLFGAAVGTGYNEFMAIESIDTAMTGTSGDITDQTWGIDTFYTASALLTKGTL